MSHANEKIEATEATTTDQTNNKEAEELGAKSV